MRKDDHVECVSALHRSSSDAAAVRCTAFRVAHRVLCMLQHQRAVDLVFNDATPESM